MFTYFTMEFIPNKQCTATYCNLILPTGKESIYIGTQKHAFHCMSELYFKNNVCLVLWVMGLWCLANIVFSKIVHQLISSSEEILPKYLVFYQHIYSHFRAISDMIVLRDFSDFRGKFNFEVLRNAISAHLEVLKSQNVRWWFIPPRTPFGGSQHHLHSNCFKFTTLVCSQRFFFRFSVKKISTVCIWAYIWFEKMIIISHWFFDHPSLSPSIHCQKVPKSVKISLEFFIDIRYSVFHSF